MRFCVPWAGVWGLGDRALHGQEGGGSVTCGPENLAQKETPTLFSNRGIGLGQEMQRISFHSWVTSALQRGPGSGLRRTPGRGPCQLAWGPVDRPPQLEPCPCSGRPGGPHAWMWVSKRAAEGRVQQPSSPCWSTQDLRTPSHSWVHSMSKAAGAAFPGAQGAREPHSGLPQGPIPKAGTAALVPFFQTPPPSLLPQSPDSL